MNRKIIFTERLTKQITEFIDLEDLFELLQDFKESYVYHFSLSNKISPPENFSSGYCLLDILINECFAQVLESVNKK